MTTDISRRRRPCVNCGGRYFARTISGLAAFIGLLAIIGTGLAVIKQSIPLGVGTFATFAFVMMLGARHRCINCDTRQ